jgi:cytochrome P450
MVKIPSSIPRWIDLPALNVDPLAFLRAAHDSCGEIAVVAEEQAVFSGAGPCAGAVAVFGAAALRQVMTDSEVFGMPVSKAKRFSLPPVLQRLNAGLFTMSGEQHRSRQHLLLRLLGKQTTHDNCAAIVRGWNAFREEFRPGHDIDLLSEMRRLVLHIFGRVIFGDAGPEVGALIQSYFDGRRRFSTLDPLSSRRELVHTGMRLDRMLRDNLAKHDTAEPDGEGCIFARLSKLHTSAGQPLSDDELVAHGNVLFMSSSEPVAVALTWALLLVSQHGELRRALRQELGTAFPSGEIPDWIPETTLPLLNAVVSETLRLLPPNAIMVRLTRVPGPLLEHKIPAACEVILSPYVDHREAAIYPYPDRFDPGRWRNFTPPSYSYYPFGIGTRYCLGRQLAIFTIVSVLARILKDYEVVLPCDQTIDWKMDITFMPSSDPRVRMLPISSADQTAIGGRITGPVASLLNEGAL